MRSMRDRFIFRNRGPSLKVHHGLLSIGHGHGHTTVTLKYSVIGRGTFGANSLPRVHIASRE
jgi:hypothetical protein